MKLFIVLAAFVSCALAGHISLESCGDSLPLYIDVPGCSKSSCSVKNHKDIVISGSFRIPKDTKALEMQGFAKWFIFNRQLEFDKKDTDLCRHIDKKCPLKAGDVVNVKMNMRIDSPFSGITPTLTLKVWGNNGVMVMCGKSDIKIVS